MLFRHLHTNLAEFLQVQQIKIYHLKEQEKWGGIISSSNLSYLDLKPTAYGKQGGARLVKLFEKE